MAWPSKDSKLRAYIDLLTSEGLPQLPASHPTRVTIRAGTLAISLAVIPSLLPLVASKQARRKFKLLELIKRELGSNGFPFALLLAFGGSAWLEWAWNKWDESSSLSNSHAKRNGDESGQEPPSSSKNRRRTAICALLASLLAIQRLQRHPKPHGAIAEIPLMLPVLPLSAKTSPSLDLTIIFAVRALDAVFQRLLRQYAARNNHKTKEEKSESVEKRLSGHLDVLLFTLATTRIMWCFFYQPFRLPRSYVKWIFALADVDERLLIALRAIRDGTWRYGERSPASRHILTSYAKDLGFPASWGDPALVPPYSGPSVNKTWTTLGVPHRQNCGGIPCQIVHGDIKTSSCVNNAANRWIHAFMKSFLIYLPVHTLPAVLTNPLRLLNDPFTLISAISRSSAFLATFIGSLWSTICLSRTVLGPKLFPNLSHQIIDGPFGGVALASFVCCFSLYIEKAKRRGEIALYVLPRAVRTLFPETWLRSGTQSVRMIERLAFTIACATLVTFARHDPACLRGLSRWGLAFIYDGWEGLRRRKIEKSQISREVSEEMAREEVPYIHEPVPPSKSHSVQ